MSRWVDRVGRENGGKRETMEVKKVCRSGRVMWRKDGRKWIFRSWGVSGCTVRKFFSEGWVKSVNPCPLGVEIYRNRPDVFKMPHTSIKGHFFRGLQACIFSLFPSVLILL